MRKKVTQKTETTLDKLVNDYGKTNEQAKELKKSLDEWNTEIKKIMSENSMDTYDSGEYKASYSVRTSSSMNEEKLLELFKTDRKLKKVAKAYGIIRTREYVDMDALESALYHESVDKEGMELLDSCKVEKQTTVLKVTKKKK